MAQWGRQLSGATRKIAWVIYFSTALLFLFLVGAAIFENTPPLFYGFALAGSFVPAIYLGAFSSRSLLRRSAWLAGMGAIGAFLATRLVAFDAYCWQRSLSFCRDIEPPIWGWPMHVLHADGHFAEEIAIFQMWLTYFLVIAGPVALIIFMRTGKKRADL